MANERTLSIIKPDAVAKNVIGEIYSRFEKADLTIVAAKMMHLTQEQAEGFYAEHKERPFFNDLVAFMTSGPVVVQALEQWLMVVFQALVQLADRQQITALLGSIIVILPFA